MKIKGLVLLACLAAVLGMFTACDKDKDPELSDMKTLGEKLDWVRSYGESGNTYTLEVSSDEDLNRRVINYGNSNITVKLIGTGGVRTISSTANTLFRIGDSSTLVNGEKPGNATLILDENIVLKGPNNIVKDTNYSGLVMVISNGNLIMNNGSKITGNGDGGVYVDSDGTFNMNGGEISGNSSQYGGGVFVRQGTFNMNGGTISGNTVYSDGGGVYVGGTYSTSSTTFSASSGTFNMSGGTISGNNATFCGGGVYVVTLPLNNTTFKKTGGVITGYLSDNVNGNVVKDRDNGNVLNNQGHAVYVNNAIDNNFNRRKETTSGPGDNLKYIFNSNTAPTISGAWEQ